METTSNLTQPVQNPTFKILHQKRAQPHSTPWLKRTEKIPKNKHVAEEKRQNPSNASKVPLDFELNVAELDLKLELLDDITPPTKEAGFVVVFDYVRC